MASMSTWPKRERPRERLSEVGAESLSDAELLALLIGTGTGKENAVDTARRILSEVGGVARLSECPLRALSVLKGLGDAKAARLTAAVELGIRIVELRARERRPRRYTCSLDFFETYQVRMGALRQEVFMVVALNTRNEVIREDIVAKGGLNECRVAPREVFRPLIADAAARAVLIHNHPSGDPSPSPGDIALTRRLADVGKLVGIPVLDHIIISCFAHCSLRDLGLFESTEPA